MPEDEDEAKPVVLKSFTTLLAEWDAEQALIMLRWALRLERALATDIEAGSRVLAVRAVAREMTGAAKDLRGLAAEILSKEVAHDRFIGRLVENYDREKREKEG